MAGPVSGRFAPPETQFTGKPGKAARVPHFGHFLLALMIHAR